jgi:outer membrane usher protein FimD/PapC
MYGGADVSDIPGLLESSSTPYSSGIQSLTDWIPLLLRFNLAAGGTGAFSHNNDSRYTNSRNNEGQSRNFSYEEIVNNRNRNNNVSGIRYDWRGGWSGNGVGDPVSSATRASLRRPR